MNIVAHPVMKVPDAINAMPYYCIRGGGVAVPVVPFFQGMVLLQCAVNFRMTTMLLYYNFES